MVISASFFGDLTNEYWWFGDMDLSKSRGFTSEIVVYTLHVQRDPAQR